MVFNDNILDFVSENYYRERLFSPKFLNSFREVLVRELGLKDELKKINECIFRVFNFYL